MTITTPISKTSISFDNNDFKSCVKIFIFTIGVQKIFKYLNNLQISKEARAWVWSKEKHTSENRSAAIEEIDTFYKNQNSSSLYSKLDSEGVISFDLNLQNLNLSSLPPFIQPEKITRIYLNNNRLNDLTQLYYLENITHLYLQKTLKTHNIDLREFKKLQFVNLESNEIRDLSQIQMPNHKIRIILDRNCIQTIPSTWMELHSATEVTLLENDLLLSEKKEIFNMFIQEKGPIFSIDIEKIEQQNSKLKKVPKSICFSEDGIGFIDLRFNEIRELTDENFKVPGLHFIDLRNNPLSYETKSRIKKIQRSSSKLNPTLPLILFDRYFIKCEPPEKNKESETVFDYRSFFKLYQEQVERDSQKPTHFPLQKLEIF